MYTLLFVAIFMGTVACRSCNVGIAQTVITVGTCICPVGKVLTIVPGKNIVRKCLLPCTYNGQGIVTNNAPNCACKAIPQIMALRDVVGEKWLCPIAEQSTQDADTCTKCEKKKTQTFFSENNSTQSNVFTTRGLRAVPMCKLGKDGLTLKQPSCVCAPGYTEIEAKYCLKPCKQNNQGRVSAVATCACKAIPAVTPTKRTDGTGFVCSTKNILPRARAVCTKCTQLPLTNAHPPPLTNNLNVHPPILHHTQIPTVIPVSTPNIAPTYAPASHPSPNLTLIPSSTHVPAFTSSPVPTSLPAKSITSSLEKFNRVTLATASTATFKPAQPALQIKGVTLAPFSKNVNMCSLSYDGSCGNLVGTPVGNALLDSTIPSLVWEGNNVLYNLAYDMLGTIFEGDIPTNHGYYGMPGLKLPTGYTRYGDTICCVLLDVGCDDPRVNEPIEMSGQNPVYGLSSVGGLQFGEQPCGYVASLAESMAKYNTEACFVNDALYVVSSSRHVGYNLLKLFGGDFIAEGKLGASRHGRRLWPQDSWFYNLAAVYPDTSSLVRSTTKATKLDFTEAYIFGSHVPAWTSGMCTSVIPLNNYMVNTPYQQLRPAPVVCLTCQTCPKIPICPVCTTSVPNPSVPETVDIKCPVFTNTYGPIDGIECSCECCVYDGYCNVCDIINDNGISGLCALQVCDPAWKEPPSNMKCQNI